MACDNKRNSHKHDIIPYTKIQEAKDADYSSTT